MPKLKRHALLERNTRVIQAACLDGEGLLKELAAAIGFSKAADQDRRQVTRMRLYGH
jgi:hypothetical protein